MILDRSPLTEDHSRMFGMISSTPTDSIQRLARPERCEGRRVDRSKSEGKRPADTLMASSSHINSVRIRERAPQIRKTNLFPDLRYIPEHEEQPSEEESNTPTLGVTS